MALFKVIHAKIVLQYIKLTVHKTNSTTSLLTDRTYYSISFFKKFGYKYCGIHMADLFELIIYVPVNNFSDLSGLVFLG